MKIAGALAVAACVAIGCQAMLFTPQAVSDGTFSHKAHLMALDIDCTGCHKPVMAGKAPGKYMTLVDANVCGMCHDNGSTEMKANLAQFLYPPKIGGFHHNEHAAKAPEASCVDCHQGLTESTSAADRNIPTMEDCWKCHSNLTTLEGESGAKCSLCHVPSDTAELAVEKQRLFQEVIQNDTPPGEVPPEVLPDTHARLMADAGIWRGGAIDQEMIPPDHTMRFREFSHGRMSMMPSAKCYACHQQRDCNECHQTIRPKDHTLRFESSVHGRRAAQRPERVTPWISARRATAWRRPATTWRSARPARTSRPRDVVYAPAIPAMRSITTAPSATTAEPMTPRIHTSASSQGSAREAADGA
ncbi:MAG: cytochrome c3 family protein [Planctomycetota bacterium]